MTRKATRFFALLAITSVALLALVACGGDDDGSGAEATEDIPSVELGGEPTGFLGVRVTPSIPKPDYTLTDTNGDPYNIVEETEGSVLLLYLGYTNCPDICPTHMLDIANTLEAMDPEDAAQVKVVFVTTDPARDTPDVIREWLDLFNPDFVGLTADQETLDQFQRDIGIQPARGQETERSGPDGYEVSHAAYVMAFTKEDNVAPLVYPFGVERDVWVNDITLLVREGFSES